MLYCNYPEINVEHPFEVREYDVHRWQHQDKKRESERQEDKETERQRDREKKNDVIAELP